jgi:hypothetical protein
MPFYLVNDLTGKQRFEEWDFVSSDVLWQGESLEVFTLETGFTLNQIGGFYIDAGLLKYSPTLKASHDLSFVPPKSPLEKLEELNTFVTSLPVEIQTQFISVSTFVKTALQAGSVEVAGNIVESVDTTGNANLEQLKSVVLAILRA